jgi:hypothetical protein
MEGFKMPEYLQVKQKHVELDYDGKVFLIKKPSALKLVDIHEEGQKIDGEKELKRLIQYQINALIDLGLDKVVAESLDLSTLKNTFTSLSQDPQPKK